MSGILGSGAAAGAATGAASSVGAGAGMMKSVSDVASVASAVGGNGGSMFEVVDATSPYQSWVDAGSPMDSKTDQEKMDAMKKEKGFTMSAFDSAPAAGKASSSLLGAGSTSFGGGPISPLLQAQVGSGFVTPSQLSFVQKF